MKKYIALFLTMLMVLGIVAGCGQTEEASEPEPEAVEETTEETEAEEPEEETTETVDGIWVPDEPVTIEFWHAMSGGNGETLEAIVQDFNDTYENIEVVPIFQGHYKDLFEKLNASAQAGTLPPLSMIYANRLTAYVMNDMVEDLGPYITDEEYGFDEEIWNDIPEGLRDNGMWDGIHYSLPFNKSAYLMYYNPDALEEKGVEVPTTWEELRAAGEALTDGDKTGIVFNKSVGVDFSFWVEQAGGHIYDEAEDKVLIDTPEVKEAYEFIVSMIEDGIAEVAFEDGYITGPMSRGEAFIGFASSSNIPHMKEACDATGVNWKVAVLPEGEEKAALFSGTDITIFNSPTEEEKKAAFEFIKYWFVEDTQVQWAKGSGYMPLTTAALESDEFQRFLEEEDPSKGIAAQMFPYAYQDPKGLNGYAIHSNMQEALEEILAGEKTIDEALADAQEEATRDMEEAKKNSAQ